MDSQIDTDVDTQIEPRISSMGYCGDGIITRWLTSLYPVEIIALYECDTPFHPINVLTNEVKIVDGSIEITPPIPYNTIIQLDYLGTIIEE